MILFGYNKWVRTKKASPRLAEQITNIFENTSSYSFSDIFISDFKEFKTPFNRGVIEKGIYPNKVVIASYFTMTLLFTVKLLEDDGGLFLYLSSELEHDFPKAFKVIEEEADIIFDQRKYNPFEGTADGYFYDGAMSQDMADKLIIKRTICSEYFFLDRLFEVGLGRREIEESWSLLRTYAKVLASMFEGGRFNGRSIEALIYELSLLFYQYKDDESVPLYLSCPLELASEDLQRNINDFSDILDLLVWCVAQDDQAIKIESSDTIDEMCKKAQEISQRTGMWYIIDAINNGVPLEDALA